MRIEPGGPSRLELGTVLASLVLALALRLPFLDRGFEGDELWTVVDFVEAPTWWDTISRVIGFNNHHFYSLLARLAESALGRSEWAIRLPALLFGVAVLPVFWLGLRRFCGRGIALVATLALATSSVHIGYSVTARGYSALVFFGCSATLLFFVLLRGSGGVWSAVLFAVATALGTWSHLYGAVVFAVQGVVLAGCVIADARVRGIDESWQRFRWPLLGAVGAVLLTALLFAPAARGLWVHLHGPRSAFDPSLPLRVLGYMSGRPISLVGLLLAALWLWGLVTVFRGHRVQGWYALLLFTLPLAAVWVSRPEFIRLRFFVFLLPLVALGLATAWTRLLRLAVGGARGSWPSWAAGPARFASAAMLALSAWFWLSAVWSNVPHGGWREATQALMASGSRPDARVGACAIGFETRFYTWYTRQPILDPGSLAEFMALRQSHDVVRCVWRRAGVERPAHDTVRQFLQSHCAPARQFREIQLFSCGERRP